MKKMLALMMAAAMTAGVLAGCGAPAETKAPESKTEAAGEAKDRLDEILERGKITVATEPYFAPNEFIDPSLPKDEQIVGADIEFANLIGETLGVEVEIVPLEFGAVLSSVADGKYDLAISGLGWKPDREEVMTLSKGYYFAEDDKGYGLVIRTEDLDKIKTVEDLADKVVIAQSGSMQELFMNQEVTKYKEFKRTSSTNDAALAVSEKKADAVSVAIAWAELYIEQNENCGLTILPDFKFTVGPEYDGTRVGMPKGNPKLEAKINEIIDQMLEDGTYAEWYDEYKDYAKSLGL